MGSSEGSVEGSIEVSGPVPKVAAKVSVRIPFSSIKKYKGPGAAVLKKIAKGVEKVTNWIATFSKRKKILLIGGGEIGTEIGIAALNRQWLVRAIATDLSQQNKRNTIVPIKNLLYYYKGIVEDCCAQAFTNDSSKLFQYVAPEKISDNTGYICSCIEIEKPNVVLLEDAFLSDIEWTDIHKTLQARGYFSKNITHFFPSPESTIRTLDKTFLQSNVFLNKTIMKEFLKRKIGEDKLLGTSDNIVAIKSLQKTTSDDYEKVSEVLKTKKLVFKLPMTSSGHGQFVISSISELTPKLLRKMKKLQKLRIKNDQYLYEEYLSNRREACLIVSQSENVRKYLGVFTILSMIQRNILQ